METQGEGICGPLKAQVFHSVSQVDALYFGQWQWCQQGLKLGMILTQKWDGIVVKKSFIDRIHTCTPFSWKTT